MDINKLRKKLEKCQNVDINKINENDIDDINKIKIDKRKSSNERMLDFLIKSKNPYFFKLNGKIVKISFSNNDKTADECLTNVLNNLYR